MLSVPPSFVTGVITMWAGILTAIPPGWVLCDGDNGTPDLRDKFVVCSGPLFAVGEEGGSFSHPHDFTTDSHTHDIEAGSALAAGTDFDDETYPASPTGLTNAADTKIPSYRLAYIMKV